MKTADFYEQITAPVSDIERVIEELEDMEEDNRLTRAQAEALCMIRGHLQDAVNAMMNVPSDSPKKHK